MKIRHWFCLLLCCLNLHAHATRLKELSNIQGVRSNQLIGYGLVVGLDGSGDQTTQTPFTVKSVLNMLQQMGVTLPPETSLQLKNVAAVMVTSSLPPFTQSGQLLDVTVSSIGNAKSLRGGTLLMTPLKGADGQIYAMAQGNIIVAGAGAAAGGSKTQINHLSVGRITGGGSVERSLPTNVGSGSSVTLELSTADFATASLVVSAINQRFGANTAAAENARVIQVQAPLDSNQRVSFIGQLENLEINPAREAAKVIINARTGSIVMNQDVQLEPCAIAHGNLTVVIQSEPVISQPAAFSNGQTVVSSKTDIKIEAQQGLLTTLPKSASLNEVVKALNSIGANPQDLLAILQAMKAAGSLRAELEVI